MTEQPEKSASQQSDSEILAEILQELRLIRSQLDLVLDSDLVDLAPIVPIPQADPAEEQEELESAVVEIAEVEIVEDDSAPEDASARLSELIEAQTVTQAPHAADSEPAQSAQQNEPDAPDQPAPPAEQTDLVGNTLGDDGPAWGALQKALLRSTLPPADIAAAVMGRDPKALDTTPIYVGPGWLAPDYGNLWERVLCRDQCAGEESATADRCEDEPQLADVIDQFQCGGSLTGDHGEVVVRVNERCAGLLSDTLGYLQAVAMRCRAQSDAGPVSFGGSSLERVRVLGHDNMGRDAVKASR